MRAVQVWQWREVGKWLGMEHLADGGIFEPLIRMATTGAVSRRGAFGRQLQVMEAKGQDPARRAA
eukprot:149597-Pyramimonas_sp.AAC.1